MKQYLVNMTFYAGSDDQEDVDNGLFLVKTKQSLTKEEMVKTFREVNEALDGYEETGFPFSYGNLGLNLDTLMEGFAAYTGSSVTKIEDNCGSFSKVDNYFEIKQRQ